MGSGSDYTVMKNCEKILKTLKIKYQVSIVSAHRTPRRMFEFAENAEKIGMKNPYETAEDVITEIQAELGELSLEEPEFPFIENPLLPSAQETPVTPNSLNLPSINNNLISNTDNSNYNNLSTAQKLAILFNQN